MAAFYDLVDTVSAFLWSGPMIIMLLGVGLYFMIRLRGLPIRRLFPAVGELWGGRKATGEGEITPWQALSTALSGQVGTGNLAGVATAISLGGPGAVFWMWITALLGMASAFAESSLAVHYRERDADGHVHGGPMYFIENGLGAKWKWLAVTFAVGTIFSALSTGNMIQSNSVAQAMVEASGDRLPSWAAGLIVAVAAFAVIIGGVKSIGSVAGKVVPSMALFYILCAFSILVLNAAELPGALATIVRDAFTGSAAVGGFIGGSVIVGIRYGVERGLFSNEAGQGSTAIAHAAAQTDEPVRQGEIAMVGTFVDTLVICTMTALLILVVPGESYKHNPARAALAMCDAQVETVDVSSSLISRMPKGSTDLESTRLQQLEDTRQEATAALEACRSAGMEIEEIAFRAAREDVQVASGYAWRSDLEASEVTTAVFRESAIPFGGILIATALGLFAFTTILGWSYYAEQAIVYLVGEWAAKPFRFVWVGMLFVGAMQQVDFIWKLGGIGNAAMAAPNLLALLLLSGAVVRLARKGGRLSGPVEPEKKPAE